MPQSDVPQGYLRDSAGRLVPQANVKPEHLLEDDLVRELHKRAGELSALLARFRADTFAEIGALLDMLAAKHGAKPGGQRGNLTLNSYDGELRVQVAIGDQLTFGPELQVAKNLIDECLTAWSEGANPNIRTVITDAFDVDKVGKLRVDRILGLRRLAIDDPKWLKAMECIGDAVRVASSRTYVRFYRRGSASDAYTQVPLDLARV